MSDRPIRPIRIAVNARSLADSSAVRRIQATGLARLLVADPGFEVTLLLPDSTRVDPDLAPAARPLRLRPGAAGELLFDHWSVPRAAAETGVEGIVFLHAAAPMRSPAPTVAVWDLADIPSGSEGARRFMDSAAASSLRGAAAVLRPSDVPLGPDARSQVRVPPLVPGGFRPEIAPDPTRTAPGLPQEYVLAVGVETRSVGLILAAWSWVEGSLGDSHTLLFLDPSPEAAGRIEAQAGRLGISESVRILSAEDSEWPAVFRGAAAMLDAGEPRGAAALRWALVAEVPIAGVRTPLAESAVGPAAYLVEPGDSRGLGGACLTLLVEQEVADRLRDAGRDRASIFQARSTGLAWTQAIREAFREARERAHDPA